MNIIDKIILRFCETQISRLSKKIGDRVEVRTFNQTYKTGLQIGAYCHKIKHRNPELN